jgi:hypothetical protein
MTLFDHLGNVTVTKRPWRDVPPQDRRSWSTFMINRFLSMEYDYVETVAELQPLTTGNMPDGAVHDMLCDLLPKRKVWNKYIKDQSRDRRTELASVLAAHFAVGNREAEEYLTQLESTPAGIEELAGILLAHGIDTNQKTK